MIAPESKVMPQTVAPSAPSVTQQNAMNRANVLANSLNMMQNVATGTIYPAANPVLNLQPRYVGLIKRFLLVLTGVISNTGTVPINLTDFGLSNLLSNITYTDPNNNQRHNTLGLHFVLLSSMKRRNPWAAAIQTNVYNGNNLSQPWDVPPASWGVFQGPQTIAAGATGNFRMVYEIPLSYGDQDLRGAVYSNLVNATQNLQFTFNNNVVTANPADNTYAVYSGAAGAAGTISQCTYTLYQNYLDQLPTSKNGIILPGIDISTSYQLKNTNFTAISQNQDFYIGYANFASFLSTSVIYNNSGAYGGRAYGTDINYWKLVAANLTSIWQYDPLLAALIARDQSGFDLPAGLYYFSSREKPIQTAQYGNMQLDLNPLTSSANAYAQVMWEYMTPLNTATSGGSLASS